MEPMEEDVFDRGEEMKRQGDFNLCNRRQDAPTANGSASNKARTFEQRSSRAPSLPSILKSPRKMKTPVCILSPSSVEKTSEESDCFPKNSNSCVDDENVYSRSLPTSFPTTSFFGIRPPMTPQTAPLTRLLATSPSSSPLAPSTASASPSTSTLSPSNNFTSPSSSVRTCSSGTALGFQERVPVETTNGSGSLKKFQHIHAKGISETKMAPSASKHKSVFTFPEIQKVKRAYHAEASTEYDQVDHSLSTIVAESFQSSVNMNFLKSSPKTSGVISPDDESSWQIIPENLSGLEDRKINFPRDFSSSCESPTTTQISSNFRPFRRQLSKRKMDDFSSSSDSRQSSVKTDDGSDVAGTGRSGSMANDGSASERRRVMKEESKDVWYSVAEGNDDDDDDDNIFSPTSSKTRKYDDEEYDPYQIFRVQNAPCLIFKVKVICGRNISLGFRDYYDTPDPYVYLNMPTSPEGRQMTTVKNDNPNPIWNEEFQFYINFTQTNILEICLMESNYLMDQEVGTCQMFDICNIQEIDVPQRHRFFFDSQSEVVMEFLLHFDKKPTLRYSLCLSDEEKEFRKARKHRACHGLRSFLGETEGPRNLNEVPTIAIIGSGGGFRAMTGFSGAFKALMETGVLDCTTYAAGLSGSSWFLSTLYSHPKWPNIDMKEFLEEMMNCVDKRLRRFLTPSVMYQFVKYLVQKRNEGQPVSFTDIFGRMVGETLLKGRMDAKLSDQREKIKNGKSAMPMYTCVHVKKNVPARSFQEWVEFSPFEIGFPKYGTFMDSKLFGSKFFMGTIVKKYDEQPLHFLQGIWGSAFSILFKRLFEDNRRIDPVEMMRQEISEQLDEDKNNSSSDCSGNEEDEEEDENENTDELFYSVNEGRKTFPDDNDGNNVHMREGNEIPIIPFKVSDSQNDSAYEGELDDDDDDDFAEAKEQGNGIPESRHIDIRNLLSKNVQHSLEKNAQSLKEKEFGDLIGLEDKAPVDDVDGNILSESFNPNKSVRWGDCPNGAKSQSALRKEFAKSSSASRQSRQGSKGILKRFIKSAVQNDSPFSLLNSRQGRAAVIHNFMRGLSLEQSYPLSPFTPLESRVAEGEEFEGIFEMHPTSVKRIYMVDAGLTFNSPYPLVLRPQREVDIILSFDFTARPTDDTQPFQELLVAEKWARLNHLPFPPIDLTPYQGQPMKEMYIFRHPTDPHCPVVLHFVLVNKTFKFYSKPGVPRKTKEEFEFAEFDVFKDPEAPYSTFNFTYTHKQFQRLSQLMEFNTLLHLEDIKEVFREGIKKKRDNPSRYNMSENSSYLLNMRTVMTIKNKMNKFIRRLGSVRKSVGSATPPFTTPLSKFPTENPFSKSKVEQGRTSDSSPEIFMTPSEHMEAPDFGKLRAISEEQTSQKNSIDKEEEACSDSNNQHSASEALENGSPNSASLSKSSSSSAGSQSTSARVVNQSLASRQSLSKNKLGSFLQKSGVDSGISISSGSASSMENLPGKIKQKKAALPNLYFANTPFSSLSTPSTGSPDTAAQIINGKGHHRRRPKNDGSRCSWFPLVQDIMRQQKAVDGLTGKNLPQALNSSSPSSSSSLKSEITIPAGETTNTSKSYPHSALSRPMFKDSNTPANTPASTNTAFSSVAQIAQAKTIADKLAAKRQKMLRRQSTVSSLNSLSIDEIEECYGSNDAKDSLNTSDSEEMFFDAHSNFSSRADFERQASKFFSLDES